MATKIARGVYRLAPSTPASAAKPSRGAQYTTNFSSEKFKQWGLSVAAARREATTAAEADAVARKMAIAARIQLEKQIEGLYDDRLRVQRGELKAIEAVNKANLANDLATSRFNASQAATASRAQVNADLRAAQVSRSKATAAAKAKAQDTVSSLDKDIIGSYLTAQTPTDAWGSVVESSGFGLMENSDDLQPGAVYLYDTATTQAVEAEATVQGRPLTEDEVTLVENNVYMNLPPGMQQHIMAAEREEADTPGGAGAPVDAGRVKAGGVGQPDDLQAGSRAGLIGGLEDRIAAKEAELAGISLPEAREPVNELRRAQEIQYNTFGPYGLGRKTPGFQQQNTLDGVKRFIDSNIQIELQKLGPDAGSEQIELATGRGRTNALMLLRGNKPSTDLVTPVDIEEPERPVTYEMSDKEAAEVRRKRGLKPPVPDYSLTDEQLARMRKQTEETYEQRPPALTDAQKKSAAVVKTASAAKTTFDAIKAGKATEAKLFGNADGKLIDRIYTTGIEGGVEFPGIYDAVDKWLDDPVKKAKALELLLVRSLLDADKKIPEVE